MEQYRRNKNLFVLQLTNTIWRNVFPLNLQNLYTFISRFSMHKKTKHNMSSSKIKIDILSKVRSHEDLTAHTLVMNSPVVDYRKISMLQNRVQNCQGFDFDNYPCLIICFIFIIFDLKWKYLIKYYFKINIVLIFENYKIINIFFFYFLYLSRFNTLRHSASSSVLFIQLCL